MHIHRISAVLGLTALALIPLVSSAAEPSADDRQFLTAYVKIHDALVTDDLPGAVKAAQSLPDNAGKPIADTKSLDAARKEFGALAPRAEKLAAGQSGYHTFFCPMAKKDWVQTKSDVENPYLGKDMLTCGVEKK